jgi:hypothetical protein
MSNDRPARRRILIGVVLALLCWAPALVKADDDSTPPPDTQILGDGAVATPLQTDSDKPKNHKSTEEQNTGAKDSVRRIKALANEHDARGRNLGRNGAVSSFRRKKNEYLWSTSRPFCGGTCREGDGSWLMWEPRWVPVLTARKEAKERAAAARH